MSARRFFVEGVHAPGNRVTIAGGDAHKIAHVLRLREGDEIEIIDSAASVFLGILASVSPVIVTLSAVTARSSNDARSAAGAVRHDPLRVTIAQGVPKGAKMDFVVEKLTELGVHAILPFYCERGVALPSPAKIERWRRLAKTAAQQCGRTEIPELSAPLSFDELLAKLPAYDRALVPWELAPGERLHEALPSLLAAAKSAIVVVGPEGGFSHDEVDAMRECGAVPISLGPRILRTETAAMVVMAILNYIA